VGFANLGSESEKCVGSHVHLVGGSISFENNFYRLPFTPPPLWFAVSVLHHLRSLQALAATRVGRAIAELKALAAAVVCGHEEEGERGG
jgi:hypothetical protein